MLAPEDVLTVLGHETRLQILGTLGEADDPLTFTELFDRVEYEGSSNFNYHLEHLTGHFVDKTDDSYVLRQAGHRVIEAVFAERPPGDADVERSRVDLPCFRCGTDIEVSYRDEHVGLYCPECGGTRDGKSSTATGRPVEATDVLGYLDLPPAGVTDRTPEEVLQAASVWTTTGAMARAREVCSGCSAPLETTVDVCEDHDETGDRCDTCGQWFAVTVHYNCTNCIYSVDAPFSTHLLDDNDLVGFMADHDIDLLGPNGFHIAALEETVLSVDPFEARFTFTVDGDALTLTVDDDLSVVDATTHAASAPRN